MQARNVGYGIQHLWYRGAFHSAVSPNHHVKKKESLWQIVLASSSIDLVPRAVQLQDARVKPLVSVVQVHEQEAYLASIPRDHVS